MPDKNWELQETREIPGVTEDQLPSSSDFPYTRAAVRWHAQVFWHRVTSALSRGGLKGIVGRIFYVGAYVWIPLSYAYGFHQAHLTLTAIAAVLFQNVSRAVKDLAPENMQFLARNYKERKFALTKLIESMHRSEEMSATEIQAFREETLQVITQYVRDHRADWKGRGIFANLLVEDGEDIVVLARNQTHRLPMVRCAKSTMLATAVFRTGEPVVVGDLQAQYPHQEAKKYKSFLLLPIYLSGKIVGVLAIDSTAKYHFDFESAELWDCLLPYMSLLAWTLTDKRVKCALAVNTIEAVQK